MGPSSCHKIEKGPRAIYLALEHLVLYGDQHKIRGVYSGSCISILEHLSPLSDDGHGIRGSADSSLYNLRLDGRAVGST